MKRILVKLVIIPQCLQTIQLPSSTPVKSCKQIRQFIHVNSSAAGRHLVILVISFKAQQHTVSSTFERAFAARAERHAQVGCQHIPRTRRIIIRDCVDLCPSSFDFPRDRPSKSV